MCCWRGWGVEMELGLIMLVVVAGVALIAFAGTATPPARKGKDGAAGDGGVADGHIPADHGDADGGGDGGGD